MQNRYSAGCDKIDDGRRLCPMGDEEIATSRIAQDLGGLPCPYAIAIGLYRRPRARRAGKAIERAPVVRESLAIDGKAQGGRRNG